MAGAPFTHASCGTCGAPLPVSQGLIVVCQYCGREHRFNAPPAIARQKRKSNASLAWAVVGTLVLVGLGIGFQVTRSFVGSPASAPAPQAGAASPLPATEGPAAGTAGPDAWNSYPQTVLVGGANGAQPNLVAMADWEGGPRLTALEGATGKVVWRVPPSNALTGIYSNGLDELLVVDGSNRVSRIDTRSGTTKWLISLAQSPMDISFGQSCVALLIPNDSKPLTLALESGQPSPCPSAPAPQFPVVRDKPSDVRSTSGDFEFLGTLHEDTKQVNPDPTRLAAQVSRAGHVAWSAVVTSLEPIWSSDGFNRSLALTPAGVFVYGRSSTEHQARWLLLELATGRTVYQKAATMKLENPVKLTSAGPFVYVRHDNRLEAYRAATGDLAWFAGN